MRTTRGLAHRLAALEGRLLPEEQQLPGQLELHFTEAWPDCRDAPGQNFAQCREHGPTCGVSVGRVRRPGRFVITMGGPWLGV